MAMQRRGFFAAMVGGLAACLGLRVGAVSAAPVDEQVRRTYRQEKLKEEIEALLDKWTRELKAAVRRELEAARTPNHPAS
jgi:hypothetical protein